MKEKRTYVVYRRGQIIFVNFSPQKGHEIKDPHYAIVLSRKDNPKNPLITVIPLTSKYHPGYLSIGKYLFSTAINRQKERRHCLDLQLQELEEARINLLLQMAMSIFQSDGEDIENHILEPAKVVADCEKNIKEGIKKLDKIFNSLARLNKETFIVTNQVTTIDKCRIINSSNIKHILQGVRVPDEILNDIDRALIRTIIGQKID